MSKKEYIVSYSGLLSVKGNIPIVADSYEEAEEKFYAQLNADELYDNSLASIAKEDFFDIEAIS